MNREQSDEQIASTIEDILRTELKAPADAEIGLETPLMGGDHEFDSLDVLMLVTATEKRFGVKIPNESIEPETFRTVGTLVEFLRTRLRDNGSAG